ncbi:LRR receptor kinase BAK1 [Camellia lanceoleosa]|nr:LRR receptor kinase BAK1 [Camellia lanceoleosa]
MTEPFFRNLIGYKQYCIDNHLNYFPDYDRKLGAERLRERRQLKSFANNLSLCGPVTGKPCPGSPPFAPSPFVPPSTISSPSGNSGTGAIAGGVAAGAALLFAAPAIGFAW